VYTHGEAVGAGMVAATMIARRMGMLKSHSASRITGLIKRAGLPVSIPAHISIKRIMSAQKHDKKMVRGINRFVLPTRIGNVRVCGGVPDKLVLEVLKEMRKGG
jgi:3-dehydroquinate synthase